MVTCTKTYSDIPFAHRQHKHSGHCALIHGHNWTFVFTFAADELDESGFVIDFGRLKWLRDWIVLLFDHNLLLNEDDPQLEYFRDVLDGLARIVTVPNCGAEGIAQYLVFRVSQMVKEKTDGRVWLHGVEVWEDGKNKAAVVGGYVG